MFEVDKGNLKVFSQEKLFLPCCQMVKDTNNGVLKQNKNWQQWKYIHIFYPNSNAACHLAGKQIAGLTIYFPFWYDEEPSCQRQMTEINIYSGEPGVKCLDSLDKH